MGSAFWRFRGLGPWGPGFRVLGVLGSTVLGLGVRVFHLKECTGVHVDSKGLRLLEGSGGLSK